MLGDRLARELDVVVGGEATADLEQCLVVARRQHVEDRSPCRCRQGVEHIGHDSEFMQAITCMQVRTCISSLAVAPWTGFAGGGRGRYTAGDATSRLHTVA